VDSVSGQQRRPSTPVPPATVILRSVYADEESQTVLPCTDRHDKRVEFRDRTRLKALNTG